MAEKTKLSNISYLCTVPTYEPQVTSSLCWWITLAYVFDCNLQTLHTQAFGGQTPEIAKQEMLKFLAKAEKNLKTIGGKQ